LGTAACAFSWSYESLIGARILAAMGTGGIQPVGMAIVASLFEPHERGRALGMWGTGIMIGPALGPTLGGYLTDLFGWRSIFSVMLLPGVITFFAAIFIIRNPKLSNQKRIPFDWWGYALLSIALIAGLLALSKGQEKGWHSEYLYTCLALSLPAFILFIAVETSIEHPLLDLSLFRFSNYTLCMILSLFRSMGLFGSIFLMPIFLQNLTGFTAIQAGLWMMPTAITMTFAMPVAGRLTDRFKPGILAAGGSFLAGLSLLIYGYLDPLSGPWMIIGPQIIRGIGLGFLMAPLMTAAVNSVPTEKVATASSFLNVANQVGGSFGIAMLNAFVTNYIFRHTTHISNLISTQSGIFHHATIKISETISQTVQGASSTPHRIEPILSSMLRHIHDAPASEHLQSIFVSLRIIIQKSSVLGFNNGFVIAGLIILSGIPLCLMIKSGWYESDKATVRA
jgi:EmrB/QacA subfamily drug resistance transporter